MYKRSLVMLVCTILLMAAIPAQAQKKGAFKKEPTAPTAQQATFKKLKGKEYKKFTAEELQKKVTKGKLQKSEKQKAARPKVKAAKKSRKTVGDPAPVAVPYDVDFTTNSEAFENDFIIINNNNDTSDDEPCTWKWSGSSGAYYVYNQDGITAADDYLVLPVTLTGGKTYEVIVNATTWNYPEEFEVVAGTVCTAEGLNTTIIDKTTPTDDPADYSGTFTPATDGVYYIAIHCTSAADQYILSIYRFAIDVQPNPAAPAAISDFTIAQVTGELKTTVTFTTPTQSIGGEELTGNVSVEVLRNGVSVTTIDNVAPGTEQSYTDVVPAEGTYSYRLTTYNAAGKGRTSAEEKVKVVMPKDLPYIVDFSDMDAFEDFTVIDNNEDGSTWEYDPTSGVAQYHYGWDLAGDDYLITVPLRLTANRKYDVTLKAAGYDDFYTERFEVLAGKSATPEGLNISVIEPTEVSSKEFTEYTGTFTADETGLYYVAIRATSAPNQFYLMVSDFKVEAAAEPTAPAAPTITAQAASQGDLTATVYIAAPTKTVEGNALTSISKMELYRNSVLIYETNNVNPGVMINYVDDSFEKSALYNYYAIAYNASGKGEKSEIVNVYVGIDQPLGPVNVKAVDNVTTIDFSWDAVGEVGLNGGYVNPANVTYSIWSLVLSPYFVLFNDKLGSVTAETSATVDFNTDEGDVQGYTYFAVRTTNESTEDEDKADWGYTALFTGKPYDTVAEGFENGELHYFWESDALMMISNYSADNDGAALVVLSEEAEVKSVVSGKLNIKDYNDPKLVFSTLGNNISKLYVYGNIDDTQWSLLQTIDLTNEYQTHQVSLESLKNHSRFARIAFAAQFVNTTVIDDDDIKEIGDFFALDKIRIGSFLNNDLSLNVMSPENVVAGKNADLDITILNLGTQDAQEYTVRVVVDGTETYKEVITEKLPAFGQYAIPIQLKTTVFDRIGVIPVSISVEYDADQNTENNIASGFISILDPGVETPTNLVAEDKGKDGVNLTWTAPVSVAKDVVEYFENGEGEFTQIDGNNDGYGWVYIYDEEYQELKCHSGYGGMQSYSYVPNVGAVNVDNWIVTPLAILDGTFSFWAAAQDSEWPYEHFAVYVSTTGNQSPDDFTQVSEEFEATSIPTEYSVDLSSYAGQEGYIAIRHFNCYDMFALVIDDVSFIKAPSVPVSYNIYFEGIKVASVEGDKTSYTVSPESLTGGNHTFGVTAVYASGLESLPATATIDVTDGINKVINDGNPVDVYTIDGKIVRRQTTSLEGLKGIYVVGGRLIMF